VSRPTISYTLEYETRGGTKYSLPLPGENVGQAHIAAENILRRNIDTGMIRFGSGWGMRRIPWGRVKVVTVVATQFEETITGFWPVDEKRDRIWH